MTEQASGRSFGARLRADVEQTKADVERGVEALRRDLEVRAVVYNDKVVGIELPQFIEMVLETVEPGSKGDTNGEPRCEPLGEPTLARCR